MDMYWDTERVKVFARSDEDVTQFAKDWIGLVGNIKPEPKIAPCPFCGGECVLWHEEFNQVRCTMVDNCGYRSQKENNDHDAISIHNYIYEIVVLGE